MTDLQALLAAVVADPSDDVARLVYADCLEEHGNAARAAFIRLQIEAERHHQDSNTRAELEGKAHALFAEHWIEWWGEVCFAVGFPMPAPRPDGRFGRLASRVRLRAAPGHPYRAVGFLVCPAESVPQTDPLLWNFWRARFRRGFPDELHVGSDKPHFLPRWSRVSPLESLSVSAPYFDDWIEGPHLAGLRELRMDDYDSEVIESVLASPHCAGLERLHLNTSDDEFRTGMTPLLHAPRVRQLRELGVTLWFEELAELFASAETLSGLTSLDVALRGEYATNPHASGGRVLAALAASPHLANLTRLAVRGATDAHGLSAVLNGNWTGLRTLELELGNATRLDPFTEPDGLGELAEFRLLGVQLNDATLSVLGRSPLLKRVKHFAVRGAPVDRTTLPKLAEAVNRDRIETFAVILPPSEPLREYAGALLRLWFGNRARVLAA